MRASGCGWRNMNGECPVFLSHVSHLNQYRLYYENDPARLSACPLTVHGLLHIAWGIKVAGPVWTYWAFAMERHCNTLLQSIIKLDKEVIQYGKVRLGGDLMTGRHFVKKSEDSRDASFVRVGLVFFLCLRLLTTLLQYTLYVDRHAR